MSQPIPPAYMGTYEELLNALLHNPFLGSSSHGRPHVTHWDPAPRDFRFAEPDPVPWRSALLSAVSAISLRDAASRLANSKAKTQVNQQINGQIERFLDDYCGTPSHVHVGPPPPPPPVIAAALNMFANSLQEGAVRNGIVEFSTQVLQRGITSAA